MPKILSDRDAARIERMLREWESNTDTRYQRRRRHGQGGGAKPRIAFSESAAAANTDPFTCFLDTDNTGDEITVFPTLNTSVTAMTLAAPLLYDGTPLVVWNDSGTWRTYITFEDAGPC